MKSALCIAEGEKNKTTVTFLRIWEQDDQRTSQLLFIMGFKNVTSSWYTNKLVQAIG